MAGQGVALIVVHGVADQKPGDTARALADLMVATEGGHGDRPPSRPSVDYVAVSSRDIVLTVDPLEPRSQAGARVDATPRAQDRSLRKTWLQSYRSDFHAAPPGSADAETDRGIALTDYLLAKHRDNGAGPEAYGTRCVRLERRESGHSQAIDLYELYWADLSRLSGALPRIVTEIFTMVFRLSTLGRDTVVEARMAPGAGADSRAWRAASAAQMTFDWLFANVLALLFAQLFLLAQIFVALGLASRVESRPLLHLMLAGSVAVLATLVFAYKHRGSPARPRQWAPAALIALIAFFALLSPTFRPWFSGALLVAGVTLAYDVVLRVGAERFPLVRIAGHTLWGGLLLLMLASAGHEAFVDGDRLDPESFDVGFHAALFGVELTLLAIKWWWIGAGFLLAMWFVFGVLAWSHKGYESRASLATGRMALMMSLATFLTLTMAIWALTTKLVEVSTENVRYSPCIFEFDARRTSDWLKSREPIRFDAQPAVRPRPAYEPSTNVCLWTTSGAARNADFLKALKPADQVSTGGLFLHDRYVNSTSAFALLATVLLLLVAYLVSMFMPSVLAELKLLAVRAQAKAHARVMRHRHRHRSAKAGAPTRAASAAATSDADSVRDRVRRLGRWLTAGFRRLDFAVWSVTAVGVLLAVSVSLLYLYEFVFGPVPGHVASADDFVKGVSQSLLKPLVLTTAGLVALLSVLGGLLSKYLPELRAPLDIALDVDNHFREFPRTGIPRGRIFSRYAALLRHVASQGYERIVIVSHSQGSVITADLLRFLSSADGRAPRPGQGPMLEGRALPAIGLLTLGCPLRQLYAARFPSLYRWMITRRGGVVGPRASDIGVARWVNAFCSGDYVGRWLWSDSDDDKDPVGHPMLDSVDPGAFGREMAYDGFVPVPPAVQPFESAAEVEVCIGFGAHTHYLESDQLQVAWLIDSLLAAQGSFSHRLGTQYRNTLGERDEPSPRIAAHHTGKRAQAMDKTWLKQYPAGVPAEIDVAQYASLVALLDESFARFADRTAYKFMGKLITFRQVDEASRAFAAWLQGQGLARGDRVAVMMPNVPQYPVAVAGILRAGYVVVNVNPLYTPRELEHQLKDSGAKLIVILENFASVLEKVMAAVPTKKVVLAAVGDMLGFPKAMIVNYVVRSVKKAVPSFSLPGAVRWGDAVSKGRSLTFKPAAVGPDDIAVLQYTGGTTGVSKGAVLLHRNLVANILQAEAWYQPALKKIAPGEQVVTICALPIYHIFGFNTNMMLGMRMGGCNILIANPRDLPAVFKELRGEKFHSFPAVNTLFNAMANHADFSSVDWSGLVISVGGGMAVQSGTAKLWLEKTGCPIVEGYGLSETSPSATCNPVDSTAYSGNIGLPMPNTELKLLDDDGNEVALGTPGEIAIKGPQVMDGYWQRPDETDKVMTADGFFRSGDIGIVDERGYFKIVDRKKDMILVSGFNVYPNEVEDVVSQMPGILECAAVGVPDAKAGEAVKLVIVKKDPAVTEAAVRAWCEANLTGYKRPKVVEFRTDLPKTNVGKILRRELRDKA